MTNPIVAAAKPGYIPNLPYIEGNEAEPIIDGNWIWCPLKGAWHVLLPEELVRQKYILLLHHKYHFSLEQMDQERKTRHGRKSPKADILVWSTVEEKNAQHAPIIIVECKSDNISIVPDDYEQGDSYARAIGEPCEFLVMNNLKETKFFRIVRGLPGTREDLENIPSLEDLNDQDRMEAIRKATKAFSRDEFRRLLFECHSLLRDNHKMEPGKAFDEISKILFIKMFVERTADHEKFTVSYLDEYARIRRRNLEDVMNDLFDDTKRYYRADDLFSADDSLNISFATFRRIVSLLERFNLGATSEDIKGIAFEKFLGQTFRGDLGQYFTPRPIVEFVIDFLDPEENFIMCDPASGSGGFLIKYFEYIRNKIELDIHSKKIARREEIEQQGYEEDKTVAEINSVYSELNMDLDVSILGSRLWNIAHNCVFGCDAEPRAARTSKMNMIMHGDGHGGIHHHDGLIDVNGIFENHFDIVITNPPFGSKVKDDQIIGATLETKIETEEDIVQQYRDKFGESYISSHERLLLAQRNRNTILSLFDLAKNSDSEKTEVLFLERCIKLLKPGGVLGIVVPDGILNNPSIKDVRNFIEDNAKILAVISIPDKTFKSTKTNVKASILFLQRYSAERMDEMQNVKLRKYQEVLAHQQERIMFLQKIISVTWAIYQPSITNPRRRRSESIQLFIDNCGENLSEEAFNETRKSFQRELGELVQEPELISRSFMKSMFDYEIFMAIADHVGIRASGKHDPINELPNIVDSWKAFNRDTRTISTDVTTSIFKIRWSEIERWDPPSFKPIVWRCDPAILKPIGHVLKPYQEVVDRDEYDFSELTPITIHFDGSIDPRDTSDSDDYSMTLFFAHPNDIVLSKIDLKNGTVGIVPDNLQNVVVTNHFVVYEPNHDLIYPPYLMRLIQTDFFKDYLWRKKVGSEGRKEVKIDIFESTLIPIPDIKLQKELVAEWERIDEQNQLLKRKMIEEQDRLNLLLISAKII